MIIMQWMEGKERKKRRWLKWWTNLFSPLISSATSSTSFSQEEEEKVYLSVGSIKSKKKKKTERCIFSSFHLYTDSRSKNYPCDSSSFMINYLILMTSSKNKRRETLFHLKLQNNIKVSPWTVSFSLTIHITYYSTSPPRVYNICGVRK